MTKIIYKYPLTMVHRQTIVMPMGQILALQVQNRVPCIWLLIDKDSEAPDQQYHIRIIGTGHDIEDNCVLSHIGTYQLGEGRLVFHVFIEGVVLPVGGSDVNSSN